MNHLRGFYPLASELWQQEKTQFYDDLQRDSRIWNIERKYLSLCEIYESEICELADGARAGDQAMAIPGRSPPAP